MNSSTTKRSVSSSPRLAPTDDVIALQQYLQTESFAYVDVAAEQARLRAYRRWPLLSEISVYLNEREAGYQHAGLQVHFVRSPK